MDKRTILGFILIAIIVVVWMFYSSINEVKPDKNKIAKTESSSTLTPDTNLTKKQDTTTVPETAKNDSLTEEQPFGKYFYNFSKGNEQDIRIETELTKIIISNKGASIKRYELKKYKSWNGYPTDLIWSNNGELFLSFITNDNKKIDTRDLFFNFAPNTQYNYKLSGNDSLVLIARLVVDEEKKSYITKQYVFYGNSYDFRTNVTLSNMEDVIPQRGYDLMWDNGLRYQERNSVDESGEAVSMASLNGDVEEFNASDKKGDGKSPTGIIDFTAIKTKYFGVAFIPEPYKSFDGTVDLQGFKTKVRDEGEIEKYSMAYRIPYRGGIQTKSFLVYLGPLQYDILKKLELSSMVNFGWKIVVRPIGEYFMLPIFTFIHKFISNYGIAIIIFSILMKILLYPLSITQMKSSQKMQLLGPEMQKLRDKYKDDQKTQQKETMKLYSQYGINPAGGCLPLLLQMPILYALWAVLRTSIDLRQANFFLWITDLAAPDHFIDLPFSLLGINSLSGLALLMGITMFIQQKMTITDPKQKAMVYMMPVMFTLLFSNFPSGLNLYYFMFNLMSIAQQYWMNKFSKNRPTLEDLKKSPKKEGWFQKKMREAQDIAESQGRSLPGKKIQKPIKDSMQNPFSRKQKPKPKKR